MKLFDYKEKLKLTYDQIAQATGIPRAIVHRACTQEGYCLKLVHAHRVVQWSNGEVFYTDLLNGDC